MIDTGLYITYGFFFLAVGAAVIFPLLHAIKHPKELGKSAIGIGFLVVVFVISYALSDSAVSIKAAAAGVGEGSSKLIGAGLFMFYIVFIIGMVGMVFSEINKILK
jgi:hypothetical protein